MNISVDQISHNITALWHTVSYIHVAMLCTLTCLLISFRTITAPSRAAAVKGEHVLNMKNLNSAVLWKELFIAYLNAALLEPILAMVSLEKFTGPQLAINLFTLGAIFSWIFLITESFDFTNIAQQQRYRQMSKQLKEMDEKERKKKYWWLRVKTALNASKEARAEISGSFTKDLALWFMFACIAAAWLPGVVTHRDCVHAYIVCFFWIFVHHNVRSATSGWGCGYFSTLLLPSAALMPLEWVLPLADAADCIEDLDGLEDWREFIAQSTGAELIIVS